MNGKYPTIVHIEVFIAWAKTHELEKKIDTSKGIDPE
jgi:hypothetical protein